MSAQNTKDNAVVLIDKITKGLESVKKEWDPKVELERIKSNKDIAIGKKEVAEEIIKGAFKVVDGVLDVWKSSIELDKTKEITQQTRINKQTEMATIYADLEKAKLSHTEFLTRDDNTKDQIAINFKVIQPLITLVQHLVDYMMKDEKNLHDDKIMSEINTTNSKLVDLVISLNRARTM